MMRPYFVPWEISHWRTGTITQPGKLQRAGAPEHRDPLHALNKGSNTGTRYAFAFWPVAVQFALHLCTLGTASVHDYGIEIR